MSWLWRSGIDVSCLCSLYRQSSMVVVKGQGRCGAQTCFFHSLRDLSMLRPLNPSALMMPSIVQSPPIERYLSTLGRYDPGRTALLILVLHPVYLPRPRFCPLLLLSLTQPIWAFMHHNRCRCGIASVTSSLHADFGHLALCISYAAV